MPVAGAAVGTRVTGRSVQITKRECLAYAAGIGDTSPAVFDDESDSFMAPPQMCVSFEWPVIVDPVVHRAWSVDADEARRGVHLVQDSEFHRPVRPGDRLTTELRIVGAERARAGAKTTLRLKTRNEHGEDVVDSWLTSIFRGVELDAEPRCDDRPPPWPEALEGRIRVIDPIEIPIALEMAHVYTECARIWNPIHTERAVAHSAGLPEPILHGTATWALAGREILRHLAGGDPRRLVRLSGRFGAMVLPGTVIRVHLEAVRTEDAGTLVRFEVRNPDGTAALADGRALLRSA